MQDGQLPDPWVSTCIHVTDVEGGSEEGQPLVPPCAWSGRRSRQRPHPGREHWEDAGVLCLQSRNLSFPAPSDEGSVTHCDVPVFVGVTSVMLWGFCTCCCSLKQGSWGKCVS